MPARIVLVHDNPDFLARAEAAVRAAGYDVATYSSSLAALDALEAAQTVELLITRVIFPEGSPHGVLLARIAHRMMPNLKVLFVGQPEQRDHTDEIGEFMPAPVTVAELVDRLSEILIG